MNTGNIGPGTYRKRKTTIAEDKWNLGRYPVAAALKVVSALQARGLTIKTSYGVDASLRTVWVIDPPPVGEQLNSEWHRVDDLRAEARRLAEEHAATD